MQTEHLVLALVALGIVTLGWTAAGFAHRHQGRHARRDAWLDRLFDKFESPDRLVAFLESPTGRELLETVRTGRAGLRHHVLGMFQTGILLGSLSVAFSLMRGLGSLGNDARMPLTALSILCLSLAIGFVLSGTVAWVLARAWGMTAPKGRDASGR